MYNIALVKDDGLAVIEAAYKTPLKVDTKDKVLDQVDTLNKTKQVRIV